MAVPSFNFTGGILTIITDMMELHFDRGEIIYVKDIGTAEVLLNSSYIVQGNYFVGFNSSDISDNINFRLPTNSHVTATPDGDYGYQLDFSPCHNEAGNDVVGSSLLYEFAVDSTTGDITISLTVTEPGATGYIPGIMYMPVVGFTGTGTSVLIDTKQILRADSDITTYTSQIGLAWSGPNATAFLGTSACFGIWNENTHNLPADSSMLVHTTDHDDLILHAYYDQVQQAVNNLVMYGGPFRIVTKTAWVDLAKAWRTRFEARTPAHPLWLNDSSWVRDIHAEHGHAHADDTSKWDDIISLIVGWGADPKMVSADLYGNEPMVNLGDIVDRLTNATPSASEITKLQTIRATYPGALPFISYYPSFRYVYDWSLWAAQSAIGPFLPAGTWPDDSVFVSGTGGPTDWTGWLAWWSAIAVLYDENGTNIMHAGSDKFYNYIVANYPAWCSEWDLSGCIWDVLGADYSKQAGQPATTFNYISDNGKWIDGLITSMAAVYAANPIGSEYSSEGSTVVPYVWYSWESSNGRGTINFPWRTALIGSYQWSRNQVTVEKSEEDGLLGAMPSFILTSDGDANYQTLYGQAKAKIFCKYEMHNDLPDTWEDGVLAYYRTNSTSKFKFIKRATGRYAYVNADNDAYILQHEFKTGESTGHKTFSDTYTSIPTVTVSSGTATNVTLTGFDYYIVSGTGSWLVFGEQPAPTYSRGDYFTLPSDAADLEIAYTAEDVTDVAAVDGDRVAQSAPSQYAIHEFKNDASGKSTCTVTWTGQTTLGNTTDFPTILEIYNTTGSGSWEELDRDTDAAADTNFTLSFPILSGLDNYKDTNGFITCRVYQSGVSR